MQIAKYLHCLFLIHYKKLSKVQICTKVVQKLYNMYLMKTGRQFFINSSINSQTGFNAPSHSVTIKILSLSNVFVSGADIVLCFSDAVFIVQTGAPSIQDLLTGNQSVLVCCGS